MPFGEAVWYKRLEDLGDMEPRWETGIWVGGEEDTNEVSIMTRSGTMKCHSGSVKRKPDGPERWDAALWEEVKGVPWKPGPNRESYRVNARVARLEET